MVTDDPTNVKKPDKPQKQDWGRDNATPSFGKKQPGLAKGPVTLGRKVGLAKPKRRGL
jgi:hypothetical protein